MLGREQREETRLAQLKESAATEKMERAAFIIFLKGEDLLNMMFDVHKEKEELLLKMPQAKGDLFHPSESSENEISETLAGFRTEFLGILKQLYELGLSELKQREAERLDIEVGNFTVLIFTLSKVGIDKAKKEVEEEGVEIIEAFVVEKESVILRLSDFAEQVVLLRLFKCIHTVFFSHIPGRTAPIDNNNIFQVQLEEVVKNKGVARLNIMTNNLNIKKVKS